MPTIKKFDFEELSSNKVFLIIFFITVIALVIRLLCLDYFLVNGILDSMWYIHAGLNYSLGNLFTFTVSNKGPLFTLFLGASIKLVGPTYFATKLVSLISGCLLSISVFFLGSELFGKKVGLISALVISINPLLILYHGLVFREPLFSLVWTTFIFFILRGFKGNKIFSILGGIFFGLASLTIEIGLFAAVGLILYFIYERFFKRTEARKFKSDYLGYFFLGALAILLPFLLRNYMVYGEAFVQWIEFLDFLSFAPQIILWTYLGLMVLIVIIVFVSKFLNFNIRFRRNSFFSFLYSSSKEGSFLNKWKKIFLILFFVVSIFVVGLYDIMLGPGMISRIALGTFKLLETLTLPESMGFMLFFSILILLYITRRSAKLVLVSLTFLFSAIGLAWGIVSHYGYWLNLDFNEIFNYIPYDPLDNAYRYVSSFIPFLAIFAVYAIFLLGDKLSNKIPKVNRSTINNSHKLRTIIVSLFIIGIVIQSFYGLSFLVIKAQKDSNNLTESYNSVVQWLYSQGSPRIYSFNTNLKNLYGFENVTVLTDESLVEIARRASYENVEFVISDIFGAYSQAQIALFLGGYNDNPSMINFDRFQLIKSYRSWPSVQIFNISLVDPNQTALVVEHNDYGGREWFSLLSQDYLVDLINDDEDLTYYFSGDYKLIVLGELKRTLTIDELEILRQKVSEGLVLIVCGLSPAYLNLENNAYWLGASEFVEAPKVAKWKITFTESAINITNQVELVKQYAFYTNSNWSSPTGLIGINEDVLVLANRVEDEAIAIYAKPYFDGTVIFNGIRLSSVKSSEDYRIITAFLEILCDKALNNELFS